MPRRKSVSWSGLFSGLLSRECHMHVCAWQSSNEGVELEDFAAKRRFGDHEVQMFNVDYIEPGNLQKAPFVFRTIEERMAMLRRSASRSLFIQVIQRVPCFQKGTISIVFSQNSWHLNSGPIRFCGTPACTGNAPNSLGKTPKKHANGINKRE